MVRSAVGLMLAVCCAIAGLLPAEARRVALVIGNADYRIGRLANPVSDAQAVAAVLERQLMLDKVILRKDLQLGGFRDALREMAREAAGAELGVIFFAGHGIEVRGRNYLVPTDAALASETAIDLEAIALDTVLRQLDGVTKLRLVILDACRTNPFPAGKRSGARGLGRIEPDSGTLVAYAAKDGTTADDGQGGRHSPFTTALLKRIAMPGLDVRRVFGYVSDDVKAATGHAQVPYLYGHLGGDEVYLLPKGPATGSAPASAGAAGLTPGHAVLPPAPSRAAAQAWEAARDSRSIALLEAFRRQYGATDAFYDRLAQERIESLRREQVALLKAEEDKKRDPALAVKPGSGASFRDRTAGGAPCPECPEMVAVPAGSFTMGSPPGEESRAAREGPQRRVMIARPFAVGKFEVARGEFATFVRETGWSVGDKCWTYDGGKWGERTGLSFRSPGYQQDDRHPVVCVSWEDATAYAGWLSRKTGKTYRLLREAEWEYVARAGTSAPFWWGSSISPGQANYSGSHTYGGGPKGEYRGKTVPADSFAPNPWGLYNVHGNVWEWVQDCYHDSYSGAPTDGSAWTTGGCSRRVLRGGSWGDHPRSLRAAGRNGYSTGGRNDYSGFRVGRMLSP